MAIAIAKRIEHLRGGPEASWAPALTAVAPSPEGRASVLFIGTSLPWVLETTLVSYGHTIDRVTTLSAGKALLCATHYQVLLAEHTVADADMVEFAAAVKAGHQFASGIPQATQRASIVLLDERDAVCLLYGGPPVDVERDSLAGFVLDLLRGP